MIEIIKGVLADSKNIDGWIIVETKTESNELFFIKKELDMNRAKEVHYFKVTVYRDFEENGIKFKGSSTASIHPTMGRDEIREAIESAAYAAGFVKNKYYPLVKPGTGKQPEINSNFAAESMPHWLAKIAEDIYRPDVFEKGCINSSELFLNRIQTRILNSEGVDVSFSSYRGDIELVTNWKEDSEEVELFKYINFANYNGELLENEVKEMLEMSRGRAIAEPMPSLGKHTVLLTGEAAKEIMRFYYSQANAGFVYEKMSTAKINESIQGENIEGDLINMKLDPFIQNSTDSAPYDQDGLPLETIDLIHGGILKRYWGDTKNSYYLGIEPTGNIRNIVVEGGKTSIDEFKKQPYLELVSFSNFQMDDFTGDFGGEVRLGWYFDGEKIIPVSGGSISGNLRDVQGKMYFSKELQYSNNFIGPKTVQMFDVTVAGN